MDWTIKTFIFCMLPWTGLSQTFPKHEMRGVWIATVENIDWPSAPGLPADVQKKELRELLDLAQQYHLNTVVLQIRPAADAFYASRLEPWSQWLSGIQGEAPEPLYDPLEFAVSECHKRGLDLHVWLNPYRALRDTSYHRTAGDHVTNAHPDWIVTYGTTRYFDPGLPEVRDHVARVVSDIVRRYEVDAVHMDDYFYPYRIAGAEFPDSGSFSKYGEDYPADRRDDWRRHNVDLIIKQIHDTIKAIKPYVAFGISPFGVWRNQADDTSGSATRAGQTNYDDLFADILKWQREAWIDYVAPQLYWNIGFEVADYKILANWWDVHTFGCPLYIGQAIYRLDPVSKTTAWRTSDEIINQIDLNRNLSSIAGSIFYSAKFLRSNPLQLKERLVTGPYKNLALPPENSRIRTIIPDQPANARLKRGLFHVKLTWNKGHNTKSFVVYKFGKGGVTDFSNPASIMMTTSDMNIRLPSDKVIGKAKYVYAVSALSQTNTESTGIFFKNRRGKDL